MIFLCIELMFIVQPLGWTADLHCFTFFIVKLKKKALPDTFIKLVAISNCTPENISDCMKCANMKIKQWMQYLLKSVWCHIGTGLSPLFVYYTWWRIFFGLLWCCLDPDRTVFAEFSFLHKNFEEVALHTKKSSTVSVCVFFKKRFSQKICVSRNMYTCSKKCVSRTFARTQNFVKRKSLFHPWNGEHVKTNV